MLVGQSRQMVAEAIELDARYEAHRGKVAEEDHQNEKTRLGPIAGRIEAGHRDAVAHVS